MLNFADDGATRLRAASTKREGVWILVYAGIFTLALWAVINQFRWWENAVGVAALTAMLVGIGIITWRRSATRTVRPKNFSRVWQASMIWAAVGMVISAFVLNTAADGQSSLWASAVAAALCTATVFACGIWLLVRAR
ncbi:hypothetical protein [Arthrobacter pigmenti]